MRHLLFLLVVIPLLAVGCRRSEPTQEESRPNAPQVEGSGEKPAPVVPAAPVFVVTDKGDGYEAAVLAAINLLGERKLPEALAAMEKAKSFQDTEFIRQEIAKLRLRIGQQNAAVKTAQDIQLVLDDGKLDDAAKLADAALLQYGPTDTAEQIAKLKVTADALATGQIVDKAERFRYFRKAALAALDEKNLRAAALASEQALQYGDDAVLRAAYDGLRKTLSEYDEKRQRAAELRRDPTRLEEAIAALEDAKKAWDTLTVRQELDECTLALNRRRDRIGVADFEVRGEVGDPLVGKTIAEELLPSLKPRFDVVERGQLAKAFEDLKLQAGELAGNLKGQGEVGDLLKARYLVLGSVTRFGGLIANARLVDLKTGLVVQTGKVTATTPEDLVKALPQLGAQLLMSDEERLAYEQQQAQQGPQVAQVNADAAIPEPPQPPAANVQNPPPVPVDVLPRPPVGGAGPNDLNQFPQQPQQIQIPGQGVQPLPVGALDDVSRARLLRISIDLGDRFFRLGRFAEALVQYQLALSLAPGAPFIQARIDNLIPFLPPPVVLGDPVPVLPVALPRVVIFDFLTQGDPRVVPPVLGPWTADSLAPYFATQFEVVDRGVAYWYMARMGLTMRDIMLDPSARRWLGRALNVRYFVFGSLTQTASFDVTTRLVDTEFGFLAGEARLHVATPFELRLRLGELTQITLMSPADRAQYLQAVAQNQQLLAQAQQNIAQNNFDAAIRLFNGALELRPGNIEIQFYIQRTRHQARERALAESRRVQFLQWQAQAQTEQQRQADLARSAEAARVAAIQQANAVDEAQRLALRRQREAAFDQLLLQGQGALQVGNVTAAIPLFEAAINLRQTDQALQLLAQARATSVRQTNERAERDRLAGQARVLRQREQDLARARQELERERDRLRTQSQALRKTQEAQDSAAFQQLVDRGKGQLTAKQFEPALVSFHAARRLQKNETVDALIAQATVNLTRAQAEAKGAAEKAKLDQQLAEQKAAREKAELVARQNQQRYQDALTAARKHLAEKHYDQAIAQFQEADKVFHTEAAQAGMAQARMLQSQAVAQAKAEELKKAAEAQRQADYQKHLKTGEAALTANQFDQAEKSFAEAGKLVPDSVPALAGLSKVRQERDRLAREAARAKAPPATNTGTVAQLLQRGRVAIKDQQWQAAADAFAQAEKLAPGDAEVRRAQTELKLARAGADSTAQAKAADEAAKKLASQVRLQLAIGGDALKSNQLQKAADAFEAARKLAPNDPAVQKALRDLATAQVAVHDTEQKKKLEEKQNQQAQLEKQRRDRFDSWMGQGQGAMAKKQYADAVKFYTQALKEMPGEAGATKALQAAQQSLASATPAQPSPYAKFMQDGASFYKQGQYAKAADAYRSALGQNPKDAKAKQSLNQAEYANNMAEGQKAMSARRFNDAVRYFEAALQNSPNNPAATQALRDAKKQAGK
jgi:tetratricopeptide (TPR) repeat protein